MKSWIKWIFKIGWKRIDSESWISKGGGVFISSTYKNIESGEIRVSTIPPVG